MNNLELTKWLVKVRDALAEQDEIRRSSMLRAADRFLKRSTQRSLALRGAGGMALDNSPSRSKPSYPVPRN
jgi:hypothetical protein